VIVGDRSSFAIESSITLALPGLGQRALGYFLIHIRGTCYGVRQPDATLLACSFGEVGDRVARRGTHQIPYLSCTSASEIAEAFLDAEYRDTARTDYFGLSRSAFIDDVYANKIPWAPDGDEAFDDGSHVLQFDVEDKVRLIAFRNMGYSEETASSVQDTWIDSDVFYDVLRDWSELFEAEWSNELRKQSTGLGIN
jgi:hypothetical protein